MLITGFGKSNFFIRKSIVQSGFAFSRLESTKPNVKILHPLPRVNEIHTDVDKNEKAYYFDQARNGVFTREAIIQEAIGHAQQDMQQIDRIVYIGDAEWDVITTRNLQIPFVGIR